MAGMPKRLDRKQIDAKFPISVKPEGYALWSLAQKLEHNLSMSVERAADYLSWSPDNCDPHMLAAQKEIVRAHLYAGFRWMFEQRKQAGREEALRDLEMKFDKVADEFAARGSKQGPAIKGR